MATIEGDSISESMDDESVEYEPTKDEPSEQSIEVGPTVDPTTVSSQLLNHVWTMRWYFQKAGEKRFRWVCLEKQGNTCICIRIQALIESTDGQKDWKDFIIKTPFWGDNGLLSDDDDQLKVIKGPHIVQRFDLPNPLDENLTTEDTYFPGLHTTLEYIENGSLSDLICRTKEAGISHLPNRLLWLIFRCLIVMCIEMDYPHAINSTGGVHDLDRPYNIWDQVPTHFHHPDLRPQHIMVGRCDPESADHKVCPILKLISLGRKYANQGLYGSAPEEGQKENLKYMGLIMESLIILENDHIDASDDIFARDEFFETSDGTVKRAHARFLLSKPGNEEN